MLSSTLLMAMHRKWSSCNSFINSVRSCSHSSGACKGRKVSSDSCSLAVASFTSTSVSSFPHPAHTQAQLLAADNGSTVPPHSLHLIPLAIVPSSVGSEQRGQAQSNFQFSSNCCLLTIFPRVDPLYWVKISSPSLINMVALTTISPSNV